MTLSEYDLRASGSSLVASRSDSQVFTISKLVDLASSGRLLIPAFQRPFVWDAPDVLKLFDSIYRGFPVGTLLLWENPTSEGSTQYGPWAPAKPAQSNSYMVVDGQQRITSLVASATSDGPFDDARFEVFFDFDKKQFVGPRSGRRPRRTIPVRELFESRRTLAWLREHEEELYDDDFSTADEVGGALRDYRVPAYVVKGNNEAVLREVFDRVNSAGKPIKRAHVFHALFGTNASPGSPAAVVDRLAQKGFGKLDENRIVQSLLAIRGGNITRDLHEEFTSDDELQEWYEITTQALQRVIDFLRSCDVPHERVLPTALPIPPLAAYFHLHPECDEWDLIRMRRWLWRGFVFGFGDGTSQTAILRKSVQAINPVHLTPEAGASSSTAVHSLLELIPEGNLTQFRIGTFRTSAAKTRLALLYLASLHPRRPNGTPIDVASHLETHGDSAVGNLVRGHASGIGARGYWLSEWGDIRDVPDAGVRQSHGFPAAGTFWKEEAGLIAETRAQSLMEGLVEFLRIKTAPEWPSRPSIASLEVLDE